MKEQIDWTSRIHELKVQIAELETSLENKKAKIYMMEYQNDREEQAIQINMINLKATMATKILQVDNEIAQYDQQLLTLKQDSIRIKRELAATSRKCKEYRKQLVELARYELSAKDYHDALKDKADRRKDLQEMQEDNTTLQTEVLRLEHEVKKANKEIEACKANIPLMEKDLQSIEKEKHVKYEEAEVLSAKVDFAKTKPEAQEKAAIISQMKSLKEEEKLLIDTVDSLRAEQIAVISKMTSLSNEVLKHRVKRYHLMEMMKEIPDEKDNEFERMLDEDADERYEKLKRRYGRRITSINAQASRDILDCQDRIQHTKQTTENIRKMLNETQLELEKYNKEEQDLNYIIAYLEKKNRKMDREFSKMNTAIVIQQKLFEIQPTFTVVSLEQDEQDPCRVLALEQIKHEHNIQSRIDTTNDEINKLHLAIDNCEKHNRRLKQTNEKGEMRLASIYKKQQHIQFFVSESPQSTEIVDKLNARINRLGLEVKSRTEAIKAKKASIANKKQLLSSVATGLETIDTPKSSEETKPSELVELKRFRVQLETEILRWKGIHSDYSIGFYLSKWSEQLPE